jgi:hypothetical protein
LKDEVRVIIEHVSPSVQMRIATMRKNLSWDVIHNGRVVWHAHQTGIYDRAAAIQNSREQERIAAIYAHREIDQ